MSFYRKAPHIYTVSAVYDGIRITARHHSLAEAGRHVVELYATHRKGNEDGVREIKKALSRLLYFWKTGGRPDGMRLHPGKDSPVKIEMMRT